jgi:hypothetical protein
MKPTLDPLSEAEKMRREAMKTMFLAAAAALSLGLGSAYAGEIEGIQPNTFFQQLPGVIAQAPVQAPVIATAQNGQAVQAYVAQSNRGTWLFQGGQSHEGANS